MRRPNGRNGGFQKQPQAQSAHLFLREPLQSEIGQVAIADGDESVRHQQAIDGDHQAGEQSGGRRVAEGGGLGAAVLGKVADQMGMPFVYQVCALLPALGLLAVFLPKMPRTAN